MDDAGGCGHAPVGMREAGHYPYIFEHRLHQRQDPDDFRFEYQRIHHFRVRDIDFVKFFVKETADDVF